MKKLLILTTIVALFGFHQTKADVLNKYNITFIVTDGQNPIEGVEITFNSGTKIVTNSQGKAVFESVSEGDSAYLITKSGYTTRKGIVKVNASKDTAILLIPSYYSKSSSDKILMKSSNSQISFEYGLEKSGRVVIDLYDMSGKLIQNIEDSQKTFGPNVAILDIADLSKGIYVVKFNINGKSSTRKLLKR